MINTRIIEIDPRELKLLKMNARFMRHEEFQRLVANIKQDGQLTSAPFAARNPDGTYEVLSGNHRVQAAIAAGLETTTAKKTYKNDVRALQKKFYEVRKDLRRRSDPSGTLVVFGQEDGAGRFRYFVGDRWTRRTSRS